jgi:hypothetical protein
MPSISRPQGKMPGSYGPEEPYIFPSGLARIRRPDCQAKRLEEWDEISD